MSGQIGLFREDVPLRILLGIAQIRGQTGWIRFWWPIRYNDNDDVIIMIVPRIIRPD